MGEIIVTQEIADSIRKNEIAEAVSLAHKSNWSARALAETFNEDELDEYAENFLAFTLAWFDQVKSGDRLAIAAWAQTRSVLEWSHIEDVRKIAAELLVRAIRAQIAAIGTLADTAGIYADGPDAGISKQTASEIRESAAKLREITWPSIG